MATPNMFTIEVGDPIFGTPEMQPMAWVVALGFPMCMMMAMVMGANDVANAFGTSVGAGVVTVQLACAIAAVFEFIGAITLGAGVSETIRKGIVDTDMFSGHPQLFILGNLCSVMGGVAWVGFATVFGLPVSSTHSIVGGILGFAIAQFGWNGVNTLGVVKIVVSMFVSPLLAGIVSASFYLATKYIVLNQAQEVALRRSRWWISLMISLVIAMVVCFVVYGVTPRKTMWDWLGALITIAVLIVCTVYLLISPLGIDFLFKRVKLPEKTGLEDTPTSAVETNKSSDNMLQSKSEEAKLGTESSIDLDADDENANLPTIEENRVVETRFASAQIVNAAYLSFNHGANDIANVAGPIASIWAIYNSGAVASKAETPLWILATMGLGIVLGLYFWGMPVMRTIGKNMTVISPSRGFAMELGTATSVLVASYLKIPVSTTQAAIGSIVAVGLCSGDMKKSVNWKLFSGIFISWIVTLPFSGLVSGLLYWGLSVLVNAVYPA